MIDLDELERALVPMDKTLSVRQERHEQARVGVEHAPGAVELVGYFLRLKHAKEYAALRNAAPELIAMARAGDALHAAVCQAVALLNVCPETARTIEGSEAHLLLRHALIDYADAMQEKPRPRATHGPRRASRRTRTGV